MCISNDSNIKFYNEIKLQRKLKGLSPIEYRITQS
ncbi:IS3 family transposase [Spiroplasma melliferum]